LDGGAENAFWLRELETLFDGFADWLRGQYDPKSGGFSTRAVRRHRAGFHRTSSRRRRPFTFLTASVRSTANPTL